MPIITNGKKSKKSELTMVCEELQALQKERAWYIKTRVMLINRLKATVACSLGYSSNEDESKRTEFYTKANALIKEVVAGDTEHQGSGIILTTNEALREFMKAQKTLEKAMLKRVTDLPVADWAEQPEQRGFGLLSLATVIGETGNLNNYPNPGKLWKRLGCAPFCKEEVTRMGSTWRRLSGGKKREEKLEKADWESFGYSPRRRSVAYIIGENLFKQNKSVYRARADEAKNAKLLLKDWTDCGKCNGTGKKSTGAKCVPCKGTGDVRMRCHLHGMLLGTKLLLKNLWIEWHANT